MDDHCGTPAAVSYRLCCQRVGRIGRGLTNYYLACSTATTIREGHDEAAPHKSLAVAQGSQVFRRLDSEEVNAEEARLVELYHSSSPARLACLILRIRIREGGVCGSARKHPGRGRGEKKGG